VTSRNAGVDLSRAQIWLRLSQWAAARLGGGVWFYHLQSPVQDRAPVEGSSRLAPR